MAYSNIDKPTDYFNTLTWTGNATDNRAITGVGFQPDWVWIKSRSNAQDHALFDSVRGANKQLISNSTASEFTRTDMLKSFDSDGFTLGDDQTGASVNYNGYTYVGWNFLAGGTASSNTDGSITSSVSVSTTSGFSIVSYTGNGTQGATIGHGLGVAPAMIIQKNRDSVENWRVYHKALADNTYMNLSTTGAVVTGNTTVWGGANPTSSVFTVGNDASVNNSGDNIITYCFAEKKGFSKAFSYTGNGSTDGSFVYCGFRPAYVLIKYTSASGQDWYIWDNKRVTYNPNNNIQTTNTSQADTITSVVDLDILSNGFKCRNTNTGYNASGGNYIGIAFAESPLVGSNLVPNNAR